MSVSCEVLLSRSKVILKVKQLNWDELERQTTSHIADLEVVIKIFTINIVKSHVLLHTGARYNLFIADVRLLDTFWHKDNLVVEIHALNIYKIIQFNMCVFSAILQSQHTEQLTRQSVQHWPYFTSCNISVYKVVLINY